MSDEKQITLPPVRVAGWKEMWAALGWIMEDGGGKERVTVGGGEATALPAQSKQEVPNG